MNTRSR